MRPWGRSSREEVFTCIFALCLDDETIYSLTHLDRSVVIALVSTGAVVEGDGGAEVSSMKDSRPRLVILTRIILLEVKVNVLQTQIELLITVCNCCLYLVSPSQFAHLILGGVISFKQIQDSRVRARLQRWCSSAQERIIIMILVVGLLGLAKVEQDATHALVAV